MRKLFFIKNKRDKVKVAHLSNFDIYFEEMEAPISYRLKKLHNKAMRTLKPSHS